MFDNEVLYHVNGKETLSSDSVIQQLVVPKELGERVLWQLHSTRTIEHFGAAKKPFGQVWDQFIELI